MNTLWSDELIEQLTIASKEVEDGKLRNLLLDTVEHISLLEIEIQSILKNESEHNVSRQ